MFRRVLIQYVLGIGLALLVLPLFEGLMKILPDIGWHFLTVLYLLILTSQISFYYLTTNFKFGWTVLSFIINFILWTLEQVTLEKNFQNSIIYQDKGLKLVILIIGGTLWVTNKILIDLLFKLNKSNPSYRSRINL